MLTRIPAIAKVLVVTVGAALTVTGCSNAPDTDGVGGGLALVNDGTLTVCISKNAYEPMYWNEGGALTGFDVDSMTTIAKEMDLEVKFSEMAFDGLLPALTSGRCDVLRSGMYINEDRSAAADSIAYLETGPALIVRAEKTSKFNEPDDLAGRRVAVQAATANEKILRELSADLESRGLSAIEITAYPELPETVAALRNDRVDATIETDVAAIQAAKTLGSDFAIVELFPAETKFGMFFQKGSPLTARVLEVAVQLSKDGTFEELAEQYGLLPSRIVTP